MHYALSWWVAAQEGRGAQGELHSAAQAHADRRGWLAAWWGGFDADRGAGPDGANRRLAHWSLGLAHQDPPMDPLGDAKPHKDRPDGGDKLSK